MERVNKELLSIGYCKVIYNLDTVYYLESLCKLKYFGNIPTSSHG